MKSYTITGARDYFKQESPNTKSINIMAQGGSDMVVSDGYHTMDELYEHRYALFIALCKILSMGNQAPSATHPVVWRSKLHIDGTMFDEMFILGIGDKPGEQITYHLPIAMWNNCDFATILERAPEWDGHTSHDVLKRLLSL